MMKKKGRRIAIATGAGAFLVFPIGAVLLKTPVLHELSFRDLLARDPARRSSAVERLGRSGWEECLPRLLHMDPENSYQVFLRQASLAVSPLLVGREWKEVQELLQRNGFEAVEAWENGSAVNAHYLLKKGFLALHGVAPLDLLLLLQARNLNGPNGPALPGKVTRADVALLADLRRPFEEVVEESPFPAGTVLAEVLDLDPVKADGATWPILKGICVSYGFIFDRWARFSPSGFRVTAEYVSSLTDAVGNRRTYYYFNSGLDPLRSVDGEEEPHAGFQPKDTLEAGRPGGSNESWRGEGQTVEASKEKFLRKSQAL